MLYLENLGWIIRPVIASELEFCWGDTYPVLFWRLLICLDGSWVWTKICLGSGDFGSLVCCPWFTVEDKSLLNPFEGPTKELEESGTRIRKVFLRLLTSVCGRLFFSLFRANSFNCLAWKSIAWFESPSANFLGSVDKSALFFKFSLITEFAG